MNAPAPQPQRTVQGMHPQTAMQMGALLHRLAGNPKTRAKVLDLVKEVEPSYRLPADVAIADLETRMKAEREQEKRAEAEEKAKQRRASGRKKLVSSHGEEVVKAIEEGVLKKYPHLDWEDAAKLYAAEDGPARPGGPKPERARHGQIWEFPDIPGLLQNPEKAASDAAYAVIDELRGRA